MPRLVNRRPKYRKHRASGQAIVTLSGRDFYLGPWKSAASRAEYDRLTGEYLACGGMLTTGDGLTVVELLAAFKRHAKGYYGPKAREYATYCTLAKQLAAGYGRTLARDFGPLRLKAFRQSLIDAGLARRTVNGSFRRLKPLARHYEQLPPTYSPSG